MGDKAIYTGILTVMWVYAWSTRYIKLDSMRWFSHWRSPSPPGGRQWYRLLLSAACCVYGLLMTVSRRPCLDKSNSTSICCGFVVQRAVQQVHNKSTTNPRQIHDKSTANRKLCNKSTTSSQQIWRLQQIHNISTCRDVVQQIESRQQVHNKSTTNRSNGV